MSIQSIVENARTLAIFGMKAESSAPGFTVPRALLRLGYRILPVNPTLEEILGDKVYPDLAALPERCDVVVVFRRPEYVGEVADQVLALPGDRRPAAVWMQSGIVNLEAAERLQAAGIEVVMDRCFLVEAQRHR